MSKAILITGATDGIGLETARALAKAGNDITIIARNKEKAGIVIGKLQTEAPNVRFRFVACDLASAASIDEAAATILEKHPRIDVLVNNAGGIFAKHALTAQGDETTFGVNHMAYARMTARLLKRLQESAPARIVSVASTMHLRGALDFDDLDYNTRRYNPIQAYCDSKLANVVFSNALAARLGASGVTSNSLHPGFVASRFGRNNGGLFGLFSRLSPLMGAVTPQDGAKTSVFLASDQSVEGHTGKYYANAREARPAPAALDKNIQDRLWRETERRLGFAIL
jgi:NAD(P)-dependent dehydrogenase (short-subunit alcohol dehydrogenase family)